MRLRLPFVLVVVVACGGDDGPGPSPDAATGPVDPTANPAREVIATELRVDVTALSGNATITLGASPMAGGSLEVGDLAIESVMHGGAALPFAVTGTQKALDYGLSPITAPLLGMLTGIGGGMLRDILVSETPAVFRGEVYALAALAGAAVVVIGDQFSISPTIAALTGAGLCFAIRIFALRHGWELPIAIPPEGISSDDPPPIP